MYTIASFYREDPNEKHAVTKGWRFRRKTFIEDLTDFTVIRAIETDFLGFAAKEISRCAVEGHLSSAIFPVGCGGKQTVG